MEELLQPYGASPGGIRGAGDGVQSHAIDVGNVSNGVSYLHARGQGAVEGVLTGPMAAAPAPVRWRAYAAMQRALFAGAAGKLFARHVDGYNAEVAKLMEQWRGFEEPGEGATAEEIAAAETAKQELEARLRLQQQALEAELDDGADTIVWMLAEGITSASLTSLWDAAALPVGATVAFPGSDYMSHVNPVARWWNLVYTNVVPAQDLYDSASPDDTAQRVHDFLRRDSHMVVEFAQLLGMERLAEPERLYLEGLGRYDSDRVNDALLHVQSEPGRDGLDTIASGVGRLEEINERIAAGEQVTYGERAYWNGWFHTIDAGVLVNLPGYVDASIREAGTMSFASQADEGQIFQRQRGTYLSPIADAVMHMSNPVVVHGPNTNAVISLDDMPQVIQDLASTEIGIDSEDGRTFNLDGGSIVTIAGVGRFAGFADLIATSTVRGGDQFTFDLGAHAIRVRQQLDEVVSNASFDAISDAMAPDNEGQAPGMRELDRFLRRQLDQDLGPGHGPFPDQVDAAVRELDDQIDLGDGAASSLLSVVGRNNAASSSLLLHDDHRVALLGDWRDDRGTVAVIAAGTDRDPAWGGGTLRQAEAAQALFLEVASMPEAYPQRMSEGVVDAAVDVGIAWIDTFTAGGPSERPISLPRDAQQEFLSFVAATGTTGVDDPGTRFGYAVQLNSVDWIADAVRAGDSGDVTNALDRAATLDGSFVRAVYEERMDHGAGHPQAALAAAAAKQRQMALLGEVASGDATSDSDVLAVWRDAGRSPGVVDPAVVRATMPSAFDNADQLSSAGASDPIVPEVHEDTFERTYDENTHAAAGSRDYLLAVAAQAAQHEAGMGGHAAGGAPLRPYAEVRNQVLRDGSLPDDVVATVRRAYGDDVALDRYDRAWERASRTRYNEMWADANQPGG
jgi:hypothetical protein